MKVFFPAGLTGPYTTSSSQKSGIAFSTGLEKFLSSRMTFWARKKWVV